MLFGLAVSGCPVTDDYFIEPAAVMAGTAGASSSSGAQGGADAQMAGASSAGSSLTSAGSGGNAGTASGSGGAADAPIGGALETGPGGESSMPCVPSTERCNGHDDNCNELIDELACNSMSSGTVGCSGFVLADRPAHGYMLCTGITRDYAHAQDACQAQSMRLAWLETDSENQEVSAKVNAASPNLETWFGANDIANEGKWFWDGNGGTQFWNGDQNGQPVKSAFSAWAPWSPNNTNNSEDCAVLNAGTASWSDRSCTIKFAYLCEEAEL
jgi:hypothetical protein